MSIKIEHVIRKALLEFNYSMKNHKISSEHHEFYQDACRRYNMKSSKLWEGIAKEMKKEMYVKGIDCLSNLHFKQYMTPAPSRVFDEFCEIIELTNWDLNKKATICEIGSGFGYLAYAFMKMMPNINYILIDIPETLTVAHKVICDGGFGNRCKFLVPNEIKGLKSDLWINIDSFQEMTPKIVSYYFKNMSCSDNMLYMKEVNTCHNNKDNIKFSIDNYPFTDNMKLIKKNRHCGEIVKFEDVGEYYITMFFHIAKNNISKKTTKGRKT